PQSVAESAGNSAIARHFCWPRNNRPVAIIYQQQEAVQRKAFNHPFARQTQSGSTTSATCWPAPSAPTGSWSAARDSMPCESGGRSARAPGDDATRQTSQPEKDPTPFQEPYGQVL